MKGSMITLMMLLSLNTVAQPQKNVRKNYVSLEVDPAPFILAGYSFSLKYSHEQIKHFTIMSSVYSSPFPDNLMNRQNYDKGFRNLRIETSYAFFADYFLRSDRNGFHFGPSVFFYSKSVEQPDNNGRRYFSSVYPNVRAGYVYQPFKKAGFYINPWINVGKEFITRPDHKPGDFVTDKISYILAIHFGYKYTF